MFNYFSSKGLIFGFVFNNSGKCLSGSDEVFLHLSYTDNIINKVIYIGELMNNDQRKLAEGVLFTDLYQLTMAQVYYRLGIHEKTAQFDYFFRSYPDYGLHQAGYCINAGLEWLLDWMRDSFFDKQSIS